MPVAIRSPACFARRKARKDSRRLCTVALPNSASVSYIGAPACAVQNDENIIACIYLCVCYNPAH